MAYRTIGSISEGRDYEFISVGTRGSVGSLVSRELDSLSRLKEHQQQRKSAKSCGRIRTETVSVLCDKRISLNSLVSRKDSIDAKKSSVYVQSPARTPRRSVDMIYEGRKSDSHSFLSGEVASPADSCRKKGEGHGLQRSRSQGRHRRHLMGEKPVQARKSVSDLNEAETGGFEWMNTPTRSLKKNRHQDNSYFQTGSPLISSGLIRDFHGKERGDYDAADDIERGRRLKSGMSLVEVVDLKCGGIANHTNNNKVNEKNWKIMSAIANRVMRGLSFSRLKADELDDFLV